MSYSWSLVVGLAAWSVAAPVPTEQKPRPGVPANDLPKLLGKSHLSAELDVVHRAMKAPPTAHYHARTWPSMPYFFHSWKSGGLELRYDGDGNLGWIHLYGGNHDGYDRYAGELPSGLSFADTKARVERLLGKPDRETGGLRGHVRCTWWYPAQGLVVEFDTFDPKDVLASVCRVSVLSPQK